MQLKLMFWNDATDKHVIDDGATDAPVIGDDATDALNDDDALEAHVME